MHIHVGTGKVARTSVTVPIPHFRVFSSQPKSFVMTQVFPCGIKRKTGDAKSSAVLRQFGIVVWDFLEPLNPNARWRQSGCAHPQIWGALQKLPHNMLWHCRCHFESRGPRKIGVGTGSALWQAQLCQGKALCPCHSQPASCFVCELIY